MMTNTMSPREELQQNLASWLSTWTTAPYGVVSDLRTTPQGRGKVRVVTFGLARTLDATVYIWSPTRLELQSSRSADIERFDSAAAFRAYCVTMFGAPESV